MLVAADWPRPSCVCRKPVFTYPNIKARPYFALFSLAFLLMYPTVVYAQITPILKVSISGAARVQ